MMPRFPIALLTASLLLAMAPHAATGDAVRLSGFWIDQVVIQTIEDGKLAYTTAAGVQVTKPLAEIEGLRLTAYPEIEQAQTAIEAADPAAAPPLLRDAMRRSRQEWATRYMQRLLAEALIAAGDPEAAVVIADLVRVDADPYFTPPPPTDLVASASEPAKARVREAIASLAAPPPRHAETVEALLAAAGPASDPAAAPATQPRPARSAPTALQGSPVLLPRWAEDGDPTVQMLRRGEFREAIAMADRQMATNDPNASYARPLYYKGLAQLALADRSADPALYKDAGLNFMRVVTFYDPKLAAVPPAMIEAAYVHQKIGRPDIAQRLLENARALLDEEADPPYHQRLMTLLASP